MTCILIVPADGNSVNTCLVSMHLLPSDYMYHVHCYNFLQLDSELRPTEQLDALALSILQELGSTATTTTEAAADPIITKYITDGMACANKECVSRATKIQAS